jgi:hypothetical protein
MLITMNQDRGLLRRRLTPASLGALMVFSLCQASEPRAEGP